MGSLNACRQTVGKSCSGMSQKPLEHRSLFSGILVPGFHGTHSFQFRLWLQRFQDAWVPSLFSGCRPAAGNDTGASQEAGRQRAPGVWEDVHGPHADGGVGREAGLGPAPDPALPEPHAAPGLLGATLLAAGGTAAALCLRPSLHHFPSLCLWPRPPPWACFFVCL